MFPVYQSLMSHADKCQRIRGFSFFTQIFIARTALHSVINNFEFHSNHEIHCFVHEIYFLCHQPGLTAVDQLKLLTIFCSGFFSRGENFDNFKFPLFKLFSLWNTNFCRRLFLQILLICIEIIISSQPFLLLKSNNLFLLLVLLLKTIFKYSI